MPKLLFPYSGAYSASQIRGSELGHRSLFEEWKEKGNVEEWMEGGKRQRYVMYHKVQVQYKY